MVMIVIMMIVMMDHLPLVPGLLGCQVVPLASLKILPILQLLGDGLLLTPGPPRHSLATVGNVYGKVT